MKAKHSEVRIRMNGVDVSEHPLMKDALAGLQQSFCETDFDEPHKVVRYETFNDMEYVELEFEGGTRDSFLKSSYELWKAKQSDKS